MRELQRVTGSIIKLPEHTTNTPVDEETTVHIIGPFFSVQVSSHQRKGSLCAIWTNVHCWGLQIYISN